MLNADQMLLANVIYDKDGRYLSTTLRLVDVEDAVIIAAVTKDKSNVTSVTQIFSDIDENTLTLGSSMSEKQLTQKFNNISNNNLSSNNSLFFMGGGVYDHYVPKIVDTLSSRSEFYTAYTPYQPEVSQGTLQYLYEFQSMICSLSGMDISNASLYDGASAVAEACMMSIKHTRKNKVLISSALHPNYIEVVSTYLKPQQIDIVLIDHIDGSTSIDQAIDYYDDNVACIVIQSPNYFGIVEDLESFNRLVFIFLLRITAAAYTGPTRLPLPTSSTPAIIFCILLNIYFFFFNFILNNF